MEECDTHITISRVIPDFLSILLARQGVSGAKVRRLEDDSVEVTAPVEPEVLRAALQKILKTSPP